jgi:hypothetical protein
LLVGRLRYGKREDQPHRPNDFQVIADVLDVFVMPAIHEADFSPTSPIGQISNRRILGIVE